MNELFLVISSACFNAMLTSYQYYWIDSYNVQRQCFDQVLISDVEPKYPVPGNSNTYVLVNPEKWRRALRYWGNGRGPDDVFFQNLDDYALGTYKNHYGQLPTSAQVKILEHISSDSKSSGKIRTRASRLLRRLRIKLEEDILEAK